MFWILSSFCKKPFLSSNTYTYKYIYGNVSSIVKPPPIIQNKKSITTTIIESIVYDNNGDFGQFVNIEGE
jgi:hypothetical protein